MFMHRIQAACAAQPQRIVLPEALDPRILKAASELMRRRLAHVTLLGQPDAIKVCSNMDLSFTCRAVPC